VCIVTVAQWCFGDPYMQVPNPTRGLTDLHVHHGLLPTAREGTQSTGVLYTPHSNNFPLLCSLQLELLTGKLRMSYLIASYPL
jgi:hypothetical protein